MAIQVNGTQVIGNSRELTNISSLDAATVAAIAAAGVGGGKANVLSHVQDTSGTFTVPIDCTLVIQVIGAGGTGCQMANVYGSNRTALATGGASGGYAVKKLTVTAGTTFTVVCGAGATPAGGDTANTFRDGLTGGNSTVTGTNVNMTANGGGGGRGYNASGYDATKTLTSNAGGSASGGDSNVTGAVSTASCGWTENQFYFFAFGCSAGAGIAPLGGNTTGNTKRAINLSTIDVLYDTAVSLGAASARDIGPFEYYQTRTSIGGPAMWFAFTASGSNRNNKRKSSTVDQVPGWDGVFGGGLGASFVTAYTLNDSCSIRQETERVYSGSGACVFTMFTDF